MKRIVASVFIFAILLVGSAPAWAAPTHKPQKPKAPRPRVLSIVVTPKVLPAAGGTVRILVRDKFATTCNLSVIPKIAHFPRNFRCAAGHFVTAVKIGKNTATYGQTIRFRVFAKGKGGRSLLRTALVSQATDTGPLGATLDVNDSNGNTLAVTMTQIIDPASGIDQYTTPNPGYRFVAVEMTLANQSTSTISDDANSDTTVIGTNSQTYTADFDSVSECTNFNYGQFTILPGSPSQSGCVVFQLPNGVNVQAVQFSFFSGLLDTAQWNV